MSEKVYIKFGLNGTYFEVEVEEIDPIEEVPIEDTPVYRKKWGQVIVKDKPYQYRTDATNKNKLYTEIMTKSPTEYMFIKHVGDDADITEGYFGIIDCEPDATTKKFIKISPEIYDQYTDLLEYADTKIDVAATKNLLKNGDFDMVKEDGSPDLWEHESGYPSYIEPNVMNLLGSNAAVLRAAYPIVIGTGTAWIPANCVIYQDILNVNGQNQIYVSFFYQLMEIINTDISLTPLGFMMTITDGVTTKYANNYGGWSDNLNVVIYETNKLPLPNDSIDKYSYFNKIFKAPEISGTLRVYFFNKVPSNVSESLGLVYISDLIISNITITASDTVYKSIIVDLPEDFIKKPLDQIRNTAGYYYYNTGVARVDKSIVEEVIDGGSDILHWYFDSETNAPNIIRLGDISTGFEGKTQGGATWNLEAIIAAMNDPNHPFYQGELCELRIYEKEGYEYRFWPFGGYKFLILEVWFAREEVLSSSKYTEEDEISEIGTEGDWKPPSEDGNWKKTIMPSGSESMLWVRKPYGGDVEYPWSLKVTQNAYRGANGLYANKITAIREYPTNEDRITFSNTVDLKEIIKKVFNNTHPSLQGKEVYSTFLWNDIPNDSATAILLSKYPQIANGVNYYTLQENFLNRVTALHTYSLKTEKKEDDDDSKLLISFNELMEDITILFPCTYYFVDENKNLHIEHLSYEDLTQSVVDITGKAEGYEVWKYLKNDMFALIDYKMINAGYKDFVTSTFEFDKIVSNRRRADLRNAKTTKLLTTDIRYCIENPNDISNGLILFCYDIGNDEKYYINYTNGIQSGKEIPNGIISFSNLLKLFGKYEGTWTEGYLDNTSLSFDHTRWTLEGVKSIELKGIYKNKYFNTNIGIGMPRSKTYDYRRGVTIVDLKYRYGEWYIIVETNDILKI